MAKTYENLDIWKKAIEYASTIYKLTSGFPKNEMFGLTSQLRRAAVSISSNIAGGSGRSTKKDFSHFIDFAIGSLNECESLITIAFNIKYINDDDFQKQKASTELLGNLIGGFKKYLSH